MKLIAALSVSSFTLSVLGCSSGTSAETSTSATPSAESVFPGCKLPSGVSAAEVDEGCYAQPVTSCTVSNGATGEPDGGVSGSEECANLCGQGTYSLLCVCGSQASPPSPSSVLGCGPGGPVGYGPAGVAYQCCPCQ